MSHSATNTTRVARKRARASLVVAAAVLLGTLFASSPSRAELTLRPGVPTLAWSRGLSAWMPPHEERFAPTSASFSAFSIGLVGARSFRSSTHVALTTFDARLAPWSLCVGPTCPGRAHVPTQPNGDPDAAMKAGSTRMINDLGPMARTALGLFSGPVASRSHPVAMRVAPMFAFGGGGLEMKCAWW